MMLPRFALLFAVLLLPASLHAIVGGKPTAAADAPWMVALIDTSITPSSTCTGSGGSATFCRHVCGGVLIAPSWVLTAAHCFIARDAANFRAVIGQPDLNATGITSIAAADVLLPPGAPLLQQVVYYNDLALLRLATPVATGTMSLADPAQVEAVETTADLFTDEASVYGWGRLSDTGDFPADLQQVALDLVQSLVLLPGQRTCEGYFPLALNSLTMICAYEPDAAAAEPDDLGDATPLDPEGEDTCILDSGGPLVMTGQGGPQVAGIVSWGQNGACGDATLPGVYTRVTAFIDWIESTTATAGNALVDLAVSISAATSVAPTSTSTVTVTLANQGVANAVDTTGFTITYSGGTLTAGTQSGVTCSAGAGSYTCTRTGGTLIAGASAFARFTAAGSADNALVIDAATTRGAGQDDYRVANDNAHHVLAFTNKPDLRATIDAAVTEISGNAGSLWLFVTVRNASTRINATDASLEITLPAGHTLVDDGALTCTGTAVLTCSLGTLTTGSNTSYRLQIESAHRADGTVDIGLTATNGDFPNLLDGQPDASATAAVTYLLPDSGGNSSSGGGGGNAGGGGTLAALALLMLGLLSLRRRR